MKSTRKAAIAALIVTSLLAVFAGSVSNAATNATTKITVASLIPGSTPEATEQFNNQVKAFEKAYPSIDVQPVEYQWTGPTFAARLAARTLPTSEVPFTGARTLGTTALADLTAEVKKLPYFSVQAGGCRRGHDLEGQDVALPKGAYAQRCITTERSSARRASTRKAPTSWAQLQAYAKQIAQRTGKTGYAQMAKDDSTGGWILTTLVYALGGDEVGRGTTKATLNNPKTVTRSTC